MQVVALVVASSAERPRGRVVLWTLTCTMHEAHMGRRIGVEPGEDASLGLSLLLFGHFVFE